MAILLFNGVPPLVQVRAMARQVDEVRKVFFHNKSERQNDNSQALEPRGQSIAGKVHLPEMWLYSPTKSLPQRSHQCCSPEGETLQVRPMQLHIRLLQ